MKKIVALLAVTILLSSCHTKSNTNVTDSIPNDVSTIICFNTQTLLEKPNTNPDSLMVALNSSLGDEQTKNLAGKLMKDPRASGLNLKDNSYIYIEGDTLGLLVGVNDPVKLKNLITELDKTKATEIKEKDGVSYYTSDASVTCWDNTKLLILTAGDDVSEGLIDLAINQLSQDPKKGISENEAFEEMLANKKDISIFQVKPPQNKKIPAAFSACLKGIQSISYISFEKGEIVMNSKNLFKDDQAKKDFTAFVSKLIAPIKGEQLGNINASPIMTCVLNLNGKGILDFFKTTEYADRISALNSSFPLEKLVDDIAGDITVSTGFDKHPEFTVIANLKDSKNFTDLFDQYAPMLGMKKTSPTSYTIDSRSDIGSIKISLDNNLLCVTSYDTLPKGNSEFSDTKGKYALFHVSTENFDKFFQNNNAATQFAAMVSSCDFTCDFETSTVKIELKDKTKNSLEVLSSFLSKNRETLVSY